MASHASGSEHWGSRFVFFKSSSTLEENGVVGWDSRREEHILFQKHLYPFFLPICSFWFCVGTEREGKEKMRVERQGGREESTV